MEFIIQGRTILLEENADADEFCVFVDGVAIAMALTETETRIGNVGSTMRELTAARPVPWIPCRGLSPETTIRVIGPFRASAVFTLSTGEAYNTWIWDGMQISLEFADDFSSVHVHWNHTVDTST